MSVISLAEAKSYLRVADAGDDTLIQALIDGAEEWVERTCAIYLTQTNVVARVDGGGTALWPPRGPVVSLSEVYDEDASAVVTATLYHLRGASGIIRDGYGRWADGRERYRLTYVAGYSTVPAGLKNALLQLIYRAYTNRASVKSEGAAGWRGDYDSLTGGDFWKTLRPYRFGKMA